jgi:hypothetical protein
MMEIFAVSYYDNDGLNSTMYMEGKVQQLEEIGVGDGLRGT